MATLGVELDMINETLPLKTVNNSKKYQRSTTLASQLSMGVLFSNTNLFAWKRLNKVFFLFLFCYLESGIIADISTSPDNEVQTPDHDSSWLRSVPAYSHQRSQTENSIQKRSNINVTQRMDADSDLLGVNSTTNPYINNDSIAVHL